MKATTLQNAMQYRLSLSRYEELIGPCNKALVQAGCTTVRRSAMFLAQIAAESGCLQWKEELASGSAYEWRSDLGNIYAGDGVRFKGRSFIQITGRSNYTNLSHWAFNHGYVPTYNYFVDNPTHLAYDKYAFLGPVWYWTVARPQLNTYADNLDIYNATVAINGGTNNLSGRTFYWKHDLSLGNAILPGDWFSMATRADLRDVLHRQLAPINTRLSDLEKRVFWILNGGSPDNKFTNDGLRDIGPVVRAIKAELDSIKTTVDDVQKKVNTTP